jgi:hypothetical protein
MGMAMSNEYLPQYSAGWLAANDGGVFAATDATVALPDLSVADLGRRDAEERRAADERAAARQDHEANHAQVARMSGFTAETVSDVLTRVAKAGAYQDWKDGQLAGLEPAPEPLSEHEKTGAALRLSRVSSGKPGRDARVAVLLHGAGVHRSGWERLGMNR